MKKTTQKTTKKTGAGKKTSPHAKAASRKQMPTIKMTTEKSENKLKNIWTLIFGIAMIITGIFAMFNTGAVLIALVLYLGVLLMMTGIVYVLAFQRIKSFGIFGMGVLNIIVGIVLMANIGIAASFLPLFLGIWALLTGVCEVIFGLYLKDWGVPTWSWRVVTGFAGALIGVLILANPAIGALTISMLIGAALIAYGAIEIGEYIAA